MSSGPNFFDACANGQIDAVANILRVEPTGIHVINNVGRSGLVCAAYHGHAQIVSLLANSNANVNICEPVRQYSALHFACGRNFPDIVDILITAGANVNAVGADGNSPLHIAIAQQSLPIVRKLIASNANIHQLTPPSIASPLQLMQQLWPNSEWAATPTNKDNQLNDEGNNEEEEEEEENENEEEDEEDSEGEEGEESEEEEEEDEDDGDEDDDDDEGEEEGNSIGENVREENACSSEGKEYFCGQCLQPLHQEVWKCTFGEQFLCSECMTKRQAAYPANQIPCTSPSCAGLQSANWMRNEQVEGVLQRLLVSCDRSGCSGKYVPSLTKAHKRLCFAGEQKCNICGSQVSQMELVSHLQNSCMGGFQIIELPLSLVTHIPPYKATTPNMIQLPTSNAVYRCTFQNDASYPPLFLCSHPSQAKGGWQVWLGMDTSNGLTKKPLSLSSKFKCVLVHHVDMVSYTIEIPISPLGHIQWAIIPSILLNSRPTLPLKISFIGFK